MRQIIEVQYNAITFADNRANTLQEDMHDQQIVSWACTSMNEDCINRTRRYFKTWASEKDPDKHNP